MKKSDFEKELFARLTNNNYPKEEVLKIIESYNIIFFEDLSSGMNEDQVVASWGSPAEIALKLLSQRAETKNLAKRDSVAELINQKQKKQTIEKQPKEKTKKEKGKKEKGSLKETAKKAREKSKTLLKNKTFWAVYLSLFFVTIPLTIAFLAILFSLCVAAICLIVVSFVLPAALILGGVYVIIDACFSFTASVNGGLILLGSGILMIGLGFLFACLCYILLKALNFPFKNKEIKKTTVQSEIEEIIIGQDEPKGSEVKDEEK